MNVRALLVTRFRELSMKIAASNRDALTLIHVAWLSDAITRLRQSDFQAILVDLDLPDAKGLKALHALMEVAPHLPILVLGDDTVLEQLKIMEHGAHHYLLKHRLDSDTLMRALHGAIARKASEGVLLSDTGRAQLAINSIGDGVLSTNNAGLITFLNPVAQTLIGWTYTEGVGRHLLDVYQVIDAATRQRVVPRLESKVQRDRTMMLPPNCVLVRRDGHESPIDHYAALIYDRSNHIAGMVVIFHDVTESRAISHTLTHSAEHVILNHRPNRALPDSQLKEGNARAPIQGKPGDSNECRSLLSLGQQRPRRFRSRAPRTLKLVGPAVLLQERPAEDGSPNS